MRKLVITEFLSLDGVYQAPGAPDEDTEGGFAHGGWQMEYGDEIFFAAALESMAQTDTMLFGRKTYDIMAAYWPTAPTDDDYARHLNGVQKYVASRTLDHVDWQNSQLLEGDAAAAVAALKDGPGNTIGMVGSGDFAQTLIDNGLVDEYEFLVCPIVLGSGKRFFRDADTVRRLELIDAKPTTTGALLLRYQPAR
jgi:dihydrofolate reductase